jgi:hypothetical protein
LCGGDFDLQAYRNRIFVSLRQATDPLLLNSRQGLMPIFDSLSRLNAALRPFFGEFNRASESPYPCLRGISTALRQFTENAPASVGST